VTRALALLLCLLCTSSVAAEEAPPTSDRGIAASALVVQPDGQLAQVEGGCWLRADACVATGRELVQLRAENHALRVALVAAGLVAAGAAGWALHAEFQRARAAAQ
jgi:hypothetical protein